MKCKNCNANLRTDYLYCPACGGKVIRNRITMKNLWFDIMDRYFNLDNTFIKTFLHLFTKPENVIEGYLQGQRRKYLNPISYLTIAITLSGFIAFLMAKSSEALNFDVFDQGIKSVAHEKMMDFLFDFQALIFVLYIPMMSVGSWLCFDQKQYNFSERTIIFMYALSQYSLALFLPSSIILLFTPASYVAFALLSLVFMAIYIAYVIKRISLSKGIGLLARLMLFFVLSGFLYFAITFLIPIILLVTGNLSLQDFKPIKN